MIIDRLENSSRIENVHPYFKLVFDYLKNTDLKSLPLGRISLCGDDVYLNVEEPSPKSRDEACLERHERYIDIQLPLQGNELYGWSPKSKLAAPEIPYDATKDCEFYADSFAFVFPLVVGEFVVFFPEDAHAPCIGEGFLRKIVVKIKC